MSCAVLLASYNGEDYIARQIDSILSQDYSSVTLYISDDGSSDGTLDCCRGYQADNRVCVKHDGTRRGFRGNFFYLLYDSTIEAEFYAFADQDDIWKTTKLSTAIDELKKISCHVPALYCSRTELIDSLGKIIGLSPLFLKNPSFPNALVQNIGGGNTMVLNNAARALLLKAGQPEVAFHDWWVYLLIQGAGGTVIYDPKPTIQYRQHVRNVLGTSGNALAKVKRLKMIVQGRYREWNDMHAEALSSNLAVLTDENRRVLQRFIARNNCGVVERMKFLFEEGIYRQTPLETFALYLATVFKKF